MKREVSPSLLEQQGFNVKSSFISQYSPEHRDRTTQLTSRKQLSSSTFLDLQESKAKFAAHRKPTRKETQYLPHANQLTRARSLKNIEDPKFKSLQIIQEPNFGMFKEDTERLKAEELLFKLKVRFVSLLKEVGVSEEDVTRFGHLAKLEEVILFVAEALRHALNEANRLASTTSSSSSKDRDALQKVQTELEQMRTKLADRETSERTLKTRLKESHGELKELYDKVNVKEKQYSQRTTELYQLRVQMKEQERAADLLKAKLQVVEKERNELKCLLDSAGKDLKGTLLALTQEKQQLTLDVTEIKEELARSKERCGKLQELNEHLNEELTRWRERVEFEGEGGSEQKSSEDAPHTPNDLPGVGVSLSQLKKSTMSMNSAYISKFNSTVRVQSLTALEIDNTRLRLQLAELQKQNEKLQRSLLNYAPIKLKYEQALEGFQSFAQLSKGLDPRKLDYLKERSGQLYRVQVESHYKRKTEQIAREWKDKLYEIVCKYEDEVELLKNDISTLKHQRNIADKKLCTLANDKYLTETRLIELEKELYALTNRSAKSLLSLPHREEIHSLEKESEGRSSEEVISSNPRLLPIQEEESPHKQRQEDLTDNVSVFNIREESGGNHPTSREDTP